MLINNTYLFFLILLTNIIANIPDRPSTIKFKANSEETSAKQEKLKRNLSLSLNTAPPTEFGINS